MVFETRLGQEPDMIWTTKCGSHFFFRGHTNLEKNLNFGENLFFWKSPKYEQKNRLNLLEDQSKSGSRLFDFVFSPQNSPPPMQIPGCATGYAPLLSTVPNSTMFSNKVKLMFSNFCFCLFLTKLG